MPKRVIDFDAMWSSDKLAACSVWARREYAWLYGLADCSGSFELTNLRVIWGKVAAIRPDLSLKRLEQIFAEFNRHGLLFVWEQNSKRYGHWTGSDMPGRLPPASWRARLQRLAPPVPADLLAEYMNARRGGQSGAPAAAGTAARVFTVTQAQPAVPRCGTAAELNGSLEATQAGKKEKDREEEKEEEQARPSAADSPPGHVLHEIWQQERGTLPAVKAMTRDRWNKCQARLGSHAGDAEQFLSDFRAAVRKASETPFLLGANERGWRATLDWLIANDTNYLKVLEGKYDGANLPRAGRAAERQSVTARALSRVFPDAEELAGRVQRALPAGDQRAERSGLPVRPGGPDGRPA